MKLTKPHTGTNSMELKTILLYLKPTLMAVALLLGFIAVERLSEPRLQVQADTARFNHVLIVSTAFIHKGQLGVLLLDQRNGNVWFLQKSSGESGRVPFEEPVFLTRVPFEKLDQAPQER
jgi:hypothetical protein